MGSNPGVSTNKTAQSLQQFRNSLDFVLETQTPMFGKFKVYKMQQKPYQYIMQKLYTALPDDVILQKKKIRLAHIPTHKNIVPFDYIDFRKVEQKCSKHLQLTVFCRYYFYTLEEAILRKTKKQSKFSQEQILYIAKTLIAVYELLHNIEQSNIQLFRTKNIFLSPEGFIKFYPQINEWRMEAKQERKTFSSRIFTFSENQVQLDLNKRKSDLIIQQKCTNDVKDIGLTLLSMILTVPQNDYRYQNDSIKQEIIKFILNSMNTNQLDNKIFIVFKPLLKGIFQSQWDIDAVKKQFEEIQMRYQFKSGSRIKIINNENQDSELTISGDNFQKQRQSRLKMMPKHQLVPRKIHCYSARPSNFTS